MAQMLLGGPENFADHEDAVYSGGSWTVPLSVLKTPIVSEKARSNGLDLTSTTFFLDLGAVRTFRFWAITHTNLTSAGLYRLTLYSDEFVTAAEQTAWLSIAGYPTEDPDRKGVSIFHVYSVAKSARYIGAELDDDANPDGFVEAGRNFLPEELGMSRNPDVGATDGETPNTTRKNALGGTGYFNRRKPVRTLSFGYNVLDDTDAPKIRRLRRFCNLDKQVVVIPDPDDTGNFNDRNFVCTLNAMPDIPLLSAGLVAGNGFELIEVV